METRLAAALADVVVSVNVTAQPVIVAPRAPAVAAKPAGRAPETAATVEGGDVETVEPLPDEGRSELGVDRMPVMEGEGDDAPIWPSETAEAAFLAEAQSRGEKVVPVAPAVVEEAEERESAKTLPKLDELVKRIPPEVRDTLEELFRVKFTTVKKVPKKALKLLPSAPAR